jgi:hypothetical protein
MMLPISGVEAVLASNGISITEDLPSDTAANCVRDRISKRAKINILGCACDDISADCAAYELDDQMIRLMRIPDIASSPPNPKPSINLRATQTYAHNLK